MSVRESKFVITYDVGGSHISAGLCRLSDLAITKIATGPLAGIDSFDGFADLLHSLGVKAAAGEPALGGASLAVPGPFDFEAGQSLMQHKLLFLYKKNLRGALATRFGFRPEQVSFLNDAAGYVLGEVGAGSLMGTTRSAGLTLGTGVGCAFVVNGRHMTTGKGVPEGGEIWNFPYRGGTVEDLISTRALKAAYVKKTGTEKSETTSKSMPPTTGSTMGCMSSDPRPVDHRTGMRESIVVALVMIAGRRRRRPA